MWDDETRPRAPATERVPGRTWAAAALRLRRCALMRKIVGGGARCEGVSTLTRHCCCASTGTAVGISCRVCCSVCVPRTVLVGYEVGGSTLLGSRRMHSVFVFISFGSHFPVNDSQTAHPPPFPSPCIATTPSHRLRFLGALPLSPPPPTAAPPPTVVLTNQETALRRPSPASARAHEGVCGRSAM